MVYPNQAAAGGRFVKEDGTELNLADVVSAQIGKQTTAANTRPNDTTAYAANDIVGAAPAANMIFGNMSNETGGCFLITGVRLRIDVASIPSGMDGFRLHLYNEAPTAIADNAAYNLSSGDRSKYLGYITIGAPVDFGDTLFAQDDNINFSGKLASGSTTIYGVLETLGAYTPSAETVYTVTLNTVGV